MLGVSWQKNNKNMISGLFHIYIYIKPLTIHWHNEPDALNCLSDKTDFNIYMNR